MRSCELLRTENAWLVACSTACILAHAYWQHKLDLQEQEEATIAAEATAHDALKRAHDTCIVLEIKLRHVQDELVAANALITSMRSLQLTASTRDDETTGAIQKVEETPLQYDADALEEAASNGNLHDAQRSDANTRAQSREGESRSKPRSRQVRISQEPEPDWLQEAAEVLTPKKAAAQQWQAKDTK